MEIYMNILFKSFDEFDSDTLAENMGGSNVKFTNKENYAFVNRDEDELNFKYLISVKNENELSDLEDVLSIIKSKINNCSDFYIYR